jgi:uncharacterized membrane protein YkvA (DUF1232 family)
MRTKIKNGLRPYVEQFKRCPRWVKIVATLCVMYLAMPIDLWDVLFPWAAFADDLFIAGVLLKLLHKYGGLPDEDHTSPLQLLKKIKAEPKKNKNK